MAKKSMILRDERRKATVTKYAAKRAELKERIRNKRLPYEERMLAMEALQKLPRDASPSRMRNRCRLTGRSRGYYRKFGLCRHKVREIVMEGEAPGVVKASW